MDADKAGARPNRLLVGCSVIAHGLQGSESKHNGAIGTVMSRLKSGRHDICLAADGSHVSVRPANLSWGSFDELCAVSDNTRPMVLANHMASGTRICLVGLSKRPELNGRMGTMVAMLPHSLRYSVHLDDGTVLSVQPINVRSDLSEHIEHDDDDMMIVTAAYLTHLAS
jgi:hypothetical protein